MNLSEKKILVTGGQGFIGKNLVKKLKSLNAKVNSFDKIDGQDITDEGLIKKTIKNNYHFIYHLAAFSGNQESLKNYNIAFKINTLATIAFFEAIVKFSPHTKIIISSSRLEYGNPKYLPVDEKHPTQPTSPYGLSKLMATQMAEIYSKTNGLHFTVFRTSNVYGQHHSSKFLGYNLINYFIDISKNNGVLKIFGQGKQVRDYLFIDDLIEAFLLAMSPKSDNQIYNLGYGEGIMLIDMAKLITKTIGCGRIAKVEWPEDWKSIETGSYVTNLSKIKKELGFSPKVKFDQGIKMTIAPL